MSRAPITGGAGFIGSHLEEALPERGWTVEVMDDLSTGSIENISRLSIRQEVDGAGQRTPRGGPTVDSEATDGALVLRILKGQTSVQQAARKHGLIMVELADWQERFAFGPREWPVDPPQVTRKH